MHGPGRHAELRLNPRPMGKPEKMTMDRGNAAWRTCFSSVTPGGHKLDALKSGVQKYLRRREGGKMERALTEIYLMHHLARSEQERKAARGIVTNLVNRLVIMMDEEMLFSEWAKYLRCYAWLDAFEAGDRADLGPLIKVCRTMCGAELLRLNSDIRGYWGRGKGGKCVAAACPQGDISAVVTPKDGEWLEAGGRAELAAFSGCLSAGDPRAYKWALALTRRRGSGAPRWRRRQPVWAGWEIMMRIGRQTSPHLVACLERRRLDFQVKASKSERHMWMSAAVSLVINRARLDWSDEQLEWDVDLREGEVAEMLADRTPFEIDDYAIDQHCSQGRSMGRGRNHFRKEGRLVVRENMEFFQPEWRSGYKRT